MREKTIKLDVGERDIAIVIHPENDKGDRYSFTLNVPNDLQKAVEEDLENMPDFLLFAFQLSMFINNSENMQLINEYFEQEIDRTQEIEETKR